MARGAEWRKQLLTLHTLEQQLQLLHTVRDGMGIGNALVA
jgi:hypothetical protein